jgi:hypothetical protein
MLSIRLVCYSREGSEWFPVFVDATGATFTYDPDRTGGNLCPCAPWFLS